MRLFPDIQVQEGDATVTYSKEGIKATRTFKVLGLDMSVPTYTVAQCIFSVNDPDNPGIAEDSDAPDVLPCRGAEHPSIETHNEWSGDSASAFCADVLTAKAISSNQVEVIVEYNTLNAITQEPSDEGDTANALLTIAGSVHSVATAVDVNGQPLTVPYIAPFGTAQGPNPSAQGGNYNIYPQGFSNGFDNIPVQQTDTYFEPFIPGTPNVNTTATIQFPTALYRFQRREQQPRDPANYVGYTNSGSWEILGHTLWEETMLCTRIENETQDNGVSWIVTYEFQYSELVPVGPSGTDTAFVTPAAMNNTVAGYMSPWYYGAYYVLGSGIGTGPNANGQYIYTQAIQPGAIPPDALPVVFAVYGTQDFNGDLQLTPV